MTTIEGGWSFYGGCGRHHTYSGDNREGTPVSGLTQSHITLYTRSENVYLSLHQNTPPVTLTADDSPVAVIVYNTCTVEYSDQ